MPATATVGALVQRTKDLLLGSSRELICQLVGTVTATATTITMKYGLPGLGRGSYLSIDTETMFVWKLVTGATTETTVTVSRGMKGTTAATHSNAALIYLNPFFTQWQIRKTLQDEIRSWAPQVFRVKTLDLTSTNFVRGYDMGSLGDWFDVLDLRESPDVLNASPSDKNWRSLPYRVDRTANTTTFPSGNALVITDPIGVFDSPRTFHVVYSAPFNLTTFTSTTTLVTTVGIDYSDLDIAPYGAAWRLAAGREIRRMLTEAQSANVDLQQFPPGYAIKAAEEFKQLRTGRLNDAIQRLRAKYPVRRV